MSRNSPLRVEISENNSIFNIRCFPNVLSLLVDVSDCFFSLDQAKSGLETQRAEEPRFNDHISIQVNKSSSSHLIELNRRMTL